jgi:SWI/SNF-related matrix-associated actin-dependent regulator 1 of chromatin subfamily A
MKEPLLTKRDSDFIFTCDYEQRMLAHKANMRWNYTTKEWYTTNAANAMHLIAYADDTTREELLPFIQNLKASYASSSNLTVPCNMGKEYYPYQLAGIEYIADKPICLLADDMGVGKTIQAIGLINYKQYRDVLIVCPSSLKLNWLYECFEWLTDSHKYCLVNKSTDRLASNGIVIVSYDMAVALHEELSHSWDLLICDESHLIKNPHTQRTQAIVGRKEHREFNPITRTYDTIPAIVGISEYATQVLYMTGSPVLNRPIELWPIVYSAKLFDSKSYFEKRYCAAKQSRFGYDAKGSSNETELQSLLRSKIMIRRTKDQVLKDLPDKTRQIIELESNYKENLPFNIEELINANFDLETFQELLNKYKISFEDIAEMRAKLGKAKVAKAIEHIAMIKENTSNPLVVFCHHKEVGEKISEHFNAPFIDGSVSTQKRQETIQQFQKEEIPLLVGTILAMGNGFTLTKANTVIFVESEWSPLWNIQAEDRLLRIGQKNAVLCQYLVISGTLDNLFIRAFISKYKVINAVLDTKVTIREEKPISQNRSTIKSEPIKSYTVPSDRVAEQNATLTVLEPKKSPLQDRDAVLPEKPTESTQKPTIESTQETQYTSIYTRIVHDTVLQSCRFLDNRNLDQATERNDIGYNKLDGRFGKSLADRDKLTDKQITAALKMLRKYHKQIPVAWYAVMYPIK